MEFFLLLLLALVITCTSSYANQPAEKYIVYLGHKGEAEPHALISSHHDILAAVKGSKKAALGSLVHSYKHGLNGFSAFLTAEEAQTVAKLPGVVRVLRSMKFSLHTTRSWDFLDSFGGRSSSKYYFNRTSTGSDVIVGVLDTGVWPESKSFDDAGMAPVPKRWKGICDNSQITNVLYTIHCNRKIIGARAYGNQVDSSYQNARDEIGHGTHTASTIAGSLVKDASFLGGFGEGVARGGLPSARLAIYKVCTPQCESDNILAAFDDAIHDGVDILSLSLGGDASGYDQDAIALGAFHAMQKGILVSCSAGNSGPSFQSSSNGAPWILTVGASTIDRNFAVDIKLGSGNSTKTLTGTAINPKPTASKLIAGVDAASRSDRRGQARFCAGNSLNASKVKGKIVLCKLSNGLTGTSSMQQNLKKLGASGVLVEGTGSTEVSVFLNLPGATVSKSIMDEIVAYANSSRDAMVSISPAKTILQTTPSPVVADFSSRGPDSTNGGILKPDLIAPGVDILAAWSPEIPINEFGNPLLTDYAFLSGTSMSCPHASAAAAFIKSRRPTWSPAAIKSALMTTARFMDNTNNPIRDYDGQQASPFAVGSGQIDPVAALNPGLVYDITPDEYTKFLCSMNYTSEQLELMTGRKLSCSPLDSYLDLNYPSISVPASRFHANNISKVLVNRKVVNVGSRNSVYNVSVTSQPGVTVSVSPPQLQFKSLFQKQGFQVTFTLDPSKVKEFIPWLTGTLTWKSKEHSVRSVYVLGLF